MTGGVDLSELAAAGVVEVVSYGRRTSVSSVHFHGDSAQPHRGSLIAAAGATTSEHQAEVVALAASAGAGVVVVRRVASAATGALCQELGISLAELAAQAEWSHLVWLVHSLVDRDELGSKPESTAQQDLFAMADALAAALGAPVTIEDAHSRVVAYSATTDGVDSTRTSTIMSRAVPPAVLRRLRATGVLKRLAHDARPFIVPALEPDFLQRLVVPLRVGGQAVGSIWAIWNGTLDAQLEMYLMTTGSSAAVSLVQLSASRDTAGRHTLATVRAALRGSVGETSARWEPPCHSKRVVALQRLSDASPADDVALWQSFFRKKSWPDPILADVDGFTFAIVPERTGAGGWEWLRDLAFASAPGKMAASRAISDDKSLPAARLEAAETLNAVRALGRPVGTYDEVWDTVVLRRAAAAVASLEHEQLRQLIREEHRGRTSLAPTLRAWLECGGDIKEAAAILHTHPNTVRHRLKKIDQLVGTSLQTHSQRLAALILLRGWDEQPPASFVDVTPPHVST
ncbi:helix-turn-helix domain-containing protein [Mycobacterium sp. ITM-2016-00317]|uniref:PucR family transcriptional regulator n=1 Tax=Mycobacterium sp. ITM-2016-00317 TaxID=2099694 RepID=UPI00287FEE5D|nr:helix-turn-helix domain-containing protein [Mycobacterium sp. ITM-2016-00317]WNG88051.1 helix-turn-helix domain-containing protein [Mycobacterium sp. ITM-2016-00317]